MKRLIKADGGKARREKINKTKHTRNNNSGVLLIIDVILGRN